MRTIWLPFIALFVQSCLQPIDEMDVDPITFLEGLFSSSPSTPSTESGFSVGGQIYGDIPTGLQLDFSGAACGPAQSASPATTGSYQFTGVPDGCSTASIVISTQPATSFCQIYNSTGLNVTSASIGNVDVYCFSVEYPAGPLTVYEGTPLSVPVRLTASPGATATAITFTSDSAAVTTTVSLNFDAANYGTYQNITLTNPVDANLAPENATITASTGGQDIGTVAANSFDSTPGSINRFLYVTSTSHDGNFAGDAGLTGTDWMQKADSFCSAPAGMPVAITGTGNYRAILTDGTLRSSTIGTQVNWPLRATVNYFGYNSLLFQKIGRASCRERV